MRPATPSSCYTKAHVDTFVIISGDSDFSPLVSKLRENNKRVIGVGVKDSTSNLLSANCDEFIFYDDLVRVQEARKKPVAKKPVVKTSTKGAKPAESRPDDERRAELFDFLVETVEALIAERGSDEKIWASMVKSTMQRRRPGFNESTYGYRSFKELVEDAQRQKLLLIVRDEKGTQYTIRLGGGEE